MNKWISVKDRLPQLSDCILQGEAFLAWDGKEIRRIPFDMCKKVYMTHWQPLPEPPRG